MDKTNEKEKKGGLLGKMERFLPILLFIGGALLLIGFFLPSEDQTEEKHTEVELVAYQAERTEEATRLVRTASGDSGAAVTLYFESGYEYVYAADKTADGRTDYLYSSGSGLLLSVKMPRVSGVAVLCKGGTNAARREELTGLLSALYGIGYDRIEIAERR